MAHINANQAVDRSMIYKVISPVVAAPSPNSSQEFPARRRRKSWRAPLVILIGLAAGLGVSLAHHFTYAYLNNKTVDQVHISQAWISRFATALAFCVKMSLTMSVGASFVQHQWFRFRLRNQAFKFQEIDALTSVLGNALSFFESSVWLRHPVLATLAAISWVIPLSAIIAPGSLTVVPARTTSVQPLFVPQPLYDGPGYGSSGGLEGPGLSPSSNIDKLMFATASSSNPVNLPWTYLDANYTLDFYAPALSCQPANDSVVRNVTLMFGATGGDPGGWEYMAWTAFSDIWDMYTSHLAVATQWGTMDDTSPDGARLFVMTNTGESQGSITNDDLSWNIVNVTECMLRNASYSVDFSFNYPNQTSKISISEWLNPVSATVSMQGDDGTVSAYQAPLLQYSLVMKSFNQLLVGYSETLMTGNDTYQANWDIVNIDWSNSTAVQRGLEQLFQNYTLSLLSEPDLIKNSSTASLVPVTQASYPQTYTYKPLDLLLPYGLALASTLVCAIVGLRAFVINDASYRNIFSTFLRAAGSPAAAIAAHHASSSEAWVEGGGSENADGRKVGGNGLEEEEETEYGGFDVGGRGRGTSHGDDGADPLPEGLRGRRVRFLK